MNTHQIVWYIEKYILYKFLVLINLNQSHFSLLSNLYQFYYIKLKIIVELKTFYI